MVDCIEGRTTLDALLEGSHHGGDANSQATGSNVLVWTEGDADMTFALSFFPDGRISASRDEYVMHPLYSVPLGSGTLLVFSPIDDLNFCHEAFFAHDAHGCRFAFVFRWLTAVRDFNPTTEAMKPGPELRDKAVRAAKAKARKRANEQRAALARA